MASTSTSSIQNNIKCDVFLSFKGQDTPKTFVDNLYHALQQKGITTFKYDERIKKEHVIASDQQTTETRRNIMDYLIRFIEDSKFHIIVLSKNYVSSSWCLDELVKIMECHKTAKHIVYPIFYDVEPTEVRHQYGPVGEALATHVEDEQIKRWKDALNEAANLVGWELNALDSITHRLEMKFIQEIVQDISLKLSLINWKFDEKLVGMDTRTKNVDMYELMV
ncbi:hypothetical protein QVD17_17704 [Tagetes erecta]|uniref:Disease-resistance protein NRSA1 n=1 Tax=Tagetes erecta TaxID=13708 RepID=Q9M7C8_TARER|nr:disease-resistance protein NRSA1 [Tagetes erecta]KAK1428864.1 hypothetical protein QVD17_17704 [Tagetes erecta]